MTLIAQFQSPETFQAENRLPSLTSTRPSVSWFMKEKAKDSDAQTQRLASARAATARSSNSASDGQLVQETLGGNRPAFDTLIRRYQKQAVAVSYRLLGNTHDALEVTQDAFLKAFTGLASLQKPEAFGGWLMRIVSNLSLNYRRSRKSRSQLPLDDLLQNQGTIGEAAPDKIDPAHQLQSAEMGDRLQSALASLPEKQRLALVMFTLESLPQKQIAETLNCSVEAVKWHVFQGRKKLKQMLKEVL
jgi:RNA polymerase sigma-70 factor, ECF subfamily